MQQERLNFLLTNRIPRRWLTLLMGWFSKIEQPLIRDLSIGLWRRFADLNLDEAKKSRFTSMHDCFTRELKVGARPIDTDPNVLSSPCDGIIGSCGLIDGVRVFRPRDFHTRCSICLATQNWSLAIATAATQPSASPQACITAFMRRWIAASGALITSLATRGT